MRRWLADLSWSNLPTITPEILLKGWSWPLVRWATKKFTGLIPTGNPQPASSYITQVSSVRKEFVCLCRGQGTDTHRAWESHNSGCGLELWVRERKRLLKHYLSIVAKSPETAIQDSQSSVATRDHSTQTAEVDTIFLPISPECPSSDEIQRSAHGGMS